MLQVSHLQLVRLSFRKWGKKHVKIVFIIKIYQELSAQYHFCHFIIFEIILVSYKISNTNSCMGIGKCKFLDIHINRQNPSGLRLIKSISCENNDSSWGLVVQENQI